MEEKSYSEESKRGLNAILDAAALVVNLDAENSRWTNATLIVKSNILHLAANARAIIGRSQVDSYKEAAFQIFHGVSLLR